MGVVLWLFKAMEKHGAGPEEAAREWRVVFVCFLVELDLVGI